MPKWTDSSRLRARESESTTGASSTSQGKHLGCSELPILRRKVVRSVYILPNLVQISLKLQGQKAAGTLFWSGVQITSRRADTGVAQGNLHQVDGGATIERVAGMGVTQPMRRDSNLDPRPVCGATDDPEHGQRLQCPALLAGTEDRVVGSESVVQAFEEMPDGGRQVNRPGLATLAENGDLPASGDGLH